METLLNRRSCRKFIRDEKVPRSDIERIVKSAQNYACSMGNQDTNFLVITNKEKLDALSHQLHGACAEFKPYLDQRKAKYDLVDTIWCDAPCVIFGTFTVDSTENNCRPKTNCGIAIMNIIAEAEALGYATLPVLMASNPPQCAETSKALGIPEGRLGLSVAIGKAHKDWSPDPKQIKEVVHWID